MKAKEVAIRILTEARKGGPGVLSNKFHWHHDDLDFHLHEKSYDNPEMVKRDVEKGENDKDAIEKARSQFKDHAHALENHPNWHGPNGMHDSHGNYKSWGHERVNGHLRGTRTYDEAHQKLFRIHNDIKNLDHITSHKTTHSMTVYRGVHKDSHDFHKMKPGTEFTDHGYTSTSLDRKKAAKFDKDHNGRSQDPSEKKHVFKIHVPPGTMAHYMDHHKSKRVGEHEVLLHRGTRFRVSHHTQGPKHHTIHLEVVGQHHD